METILCIVPIILGKSASVLLIDEFVFDRLQSVHGKEPLWMKRTTAVLLLSRFPMEYRGLTSLTSLQQSGPVWRSCNGRASRSLKR